MVRQFFAVVLLVLAGCSPSIETAQEKIDPPAPPEIELPSVVFLTTNWYPQTAQNEDETENRIVREIVRQGVLLALREEMGLVTRDATLGEPFPAANREGSSADEIASKALDLWLELEADGAWNARLHGAGASFENPIWRHEGKVEFNKRTIYAELAKQVADLTGEIADSLRAAGGKGEAKKLDPENLPDAEIEKLLTEMNFVSQYAAVRAAHQAITQKGISSEWLGVLVRGYAHLALLTDHTWASQSEAFAARSLLYAERIGQITEQSAVAQWYRAYAFAVIGMHGAALDVLETVPQPSGEEELPAWTRLIEPYAEFQHDALDAVASDHSELAETVALLEWHAYAAYQHGRWIYEKGLDAMQQIPEAYGVYSVMSGWSALRIKRMGSYRGVEGFGDLLPKRVATLSDLPESIKPLTVSQGGLLSQLLGRRPDTAFSDRPIKISRALIQVTSEDAEPTECSWAILGQLIADEQFTQAADALVVAGDAVEHSRAGLVDRLRPLVEGHRYAPYIESFAYSPREEEARTELLRQISVVDPKGNMKRFFHHTWQIPLADGEKGALYSWRAVWGRNFTLPGMFESYYGSVESWDKSFTQEHREQFAKDFAEISPHSPNAVRVPLETGEEIHADRLVRAEKEMADDPVGWMMIGNRYYSLNMLDDSARCFKRSLEISPCMDSTRGLANSYYYNGKKELWQPTLEAYLQVEDLGLAHAEVHQLIATENFNNRDWKKAEPHALAAAQVYSGSSLILASRVYEGMQNWERSEHFISEATSSYPSYWAGSEWYFWCRRTGRGDIDAAREYAARSIEIASRSTRLDDADRVFAYRLLENDAQGALTGLDQQMALCPDSADVWDTMWRKLHVINACDALKYDERKAATITEVRQLADTEIAKTHANWTKLYNELCDIYEGQEATDEFLKYFDEVMTDADKIYRCNYWYFLGVVLEQQDKTDLADKYLRKAAFQGTFERYNATLAGHRLSQRYGPERGGLPEEFAEIEAELAAKAEAESAEEASEDAAVGDDDQSI